MEDILSIKVKNTESQRGYSNFKNELCAFIEESSVHGLHLIVNQRISMIRRIIWAIIIAIGSGTLIFVVAKSFENYLNYEVKTTIKDVYADELVFPAITICNINRYRKSKINGTDFEKWLLDTYSVLNSVIYKREPDADLVVDLNRTDFMVKVAHQKKSMIAHCVWNSGVDQSCGSENFSTVFTDQGVCFSFNGDMKNPLIVKRTGPRSGLQVYLYIEKEEYTFGSFDSTVGVKVSLHPQDEPSLITFRALSAPDGGSAFIGIKKSEILSKESPYSSNCQSGGLRFSERYSYYGCLAQEISDEILYRCGCKEPYMQEIDARICNFNESVKCAELIFDSLQVKCQTPCMRILYTPEISYSAFPSEHVIPDLTAIFNKSADQLRDNYVALSIYYKELVYQMTEEKAEYSLDDLMGNIGGILGICLGASALSIYELFEFIFVTILNFIKRTNKTSP